MDAGVGQLHVAGEFVHMAVRVWTEPDDDRIDAVRKRRIVRGSARDHQRDASFVDQDRIGFINDGEGKWALDYFVDAPRQSVAQVIEAHLVGRRVRNVAQVRGAAIGRGHALRDVRDGQAEPFIDAAHPQRIAASEIIVGRQHVDSARVQRRPNDGRGGGQRLAFAGLHLNDVPAHESKCPQNLYVEHPQPENSLGDDRNQRECFHQVRSRNGPELIVIQPGQLHAPPVYRMQLGLGRGVHEAEKTQYFS